MAKALLSPLSRGTAVKNGRLYRKQVLPLTTINYNGKKITFDRPYLQDLCDSFNKGAYDQVPFIFADGNNAHNESPENFRGDVKGFELADDGLYMLMEPTAEGAKVLDANPQLGVSARIIEGVTKATGETFPRAVRHILGTMFPKVPTMGPWTAVDLAEDPDISEVVDLTAESYEEGSDMAKTKSRRRGQRATFDFSKLSDEQFEDLIDLAAAATLERDEVDEDGDEDGLEDEVDEDGDEDDADKPKGKKKSKVKKTLVVEKESEGEEDEDEDEDEDGTELSDKPKTRTRKVRESDADRRVRTVEVNLAAEAFRRDKKDWIDDGVPPFLIDLAAPVLALPDPQIVDLSDGKTGDAREILRQMLDGVKGMIDLSAEMGSSIDASDLGVENDPDAALIDEWDSSYS